MLRSTQPLKFVWKYLRMRRPPRNGYDVFEIRKEAALTDLAKQNMNKVLITIVYKKDCPLSTAYLTSLNRVPLGNPKDLVVSIIPSDCCPKLIEKQNIVALPTTLVTHGENVEFRVVGAKASELGLKSRFALRRNGLNIFAAMDSDY